tara:strand:- start:2078 stop:3568 length:1491 start_codon:yes stop_codon:yes gene_type:complete
MATNNHKDNHPLMKRTKDIEAMVPYWDKVDDIVEGYDAIKSEGKKYLPKFPTETSDDYMTRLEYTKFTNIYRDVLEGLSSKPFEDEVKILDGETPPSDAIKEFAKDVDGSGNNLTVFSSLTFYNGINSAIDWIMVDYPEVDATQVRTQADQKNAGIRPFWSHILAKNVFEIRTKFIQTKEVIVYFRMFEPAHEENEDRVRVFERNKDGTVTWKLYEYNPKAKKPEDAFVQIKTGTISIGIIPFVPFSTGRRDGKTFKYYPAMRDAADLQITLYRNESALEFTKTMACYPMLAANGMKPEKEKDGTTNKKLGIGPMKVLYGVPDGNGNHGEWKFIEPSANSMEFMQKNIASTKQDLRELGRQPLTALSQQLTTVTTSVAAGKAKSAVTAWANALKDALENALVLTSIWMGETNYDPKVHVFTGFDNVLDDGKDLDALNSARDRGDLSRETYLGEYKRRKVLSPEFDIEAENKRLLNEIPSDGVDSPMIEDEDVNNNV